MSLNLYSGYSEPSPRLAAVGFVLCFFGLSAYDYYHRSPPLATTPTEQTSCPSRPIEFLERSR